MPEKRPYVRCFVLYVFGPRRLLGSELTTATLTDLEVVARALARVDVRSACDGRPEYRALSRLFTCWTVEAHALMARVAPDRRYATGS